jgi:cytochrome d ubiquinol oxidase subunit I
VQGLEEWPRDERPNSTVVFWSFRAMVGLGLAIFALGLWSLVQRLRGRLYASRGLLRTAVALGPAGIVAIIAGWITTEVGRQPWVIHGLLRTADARSPVAAEAVAASLVAFAVVYLVVFGAGVYYLLRLLHHPPASAEAGLSPKQPLRASGLMPAPVMARGEDNGR